MTEKREAPVQFRAGDLAPALDARGPNRNETAQRDLTRYYALLDRALADLALTPDEAAAIVDALNGTMLDETSAPLLWMEIADAVRLDGLAAKWPIDGAALVAKLQALSPLQAFALADAVERYWSGPHERDRLVGLRAVGLLR